MAYTQSVLYDRSGGTGKVSGVAVATLTSLLFFIGPTIASYIPRCMAGTLLLHVGSDLFLEGVYDSYGKFDRLEYFGIWLIVIVMTLYGKLGSLLFTDTPGTLCKLDTTFISFFFSRPDPFVGMDAAMAAGVLAAISTYAVQSITYLAPLRGAMSAATLRSSNFTRSQRANEILDDPVTGRQRVFVIQLQGHLFFGNMAQLTEGIVSR